MIYDLHSHSNHSDGLLSPADVVQRAKDNGVDVLALTDHDTLSGLAEAQAAADQLGLKLIPGVEISVSWGKRVFHVVGLKIDAENKQLCDGLQELTKQRHSRAQKIAERLEKCGIENALTAAKDLAGEGNVTRTHFARAILAAGKAKSEADAFGKYLAQGKKAYVKTQWAGLDEAVNWIKAAGGVAVLAHPARYKMSQTVMREFLGDFVRAGGAGLEILNGGLSADMIRQNIRLAERFGLQGSAGSDFHNPAFPWTDLGRLPAMPREITPIWHSWTE